MLAIINTTCPVGLIALARSLGVLERLVTPSVKSLLCKPEDLCWIPSTHIKTLEGKHRPHNPSPEKVEAGGFLAFARQIIKSTGQLQLQWRPSLRK